MALFPNRRPEVSTTLPTSAASVPTPRPAPEEEVRVRGVVRDAAVIEPMRQRWAERLQQNGDLVLMQSQTGSSADRERNKESVRGALVEISKSDAGGLSKGEREGLVEELVAELVGYGPIEGLLARDDISEIMVNGAGMIFIERKGMMEHVPGLIFRSEELLLRICQRMVGAVNRRVDAQTPLCDARLPDGSRINVVIPPIAVDGTHLTVRKFRKDKLTLKDLVAFKSLTPEAAEVLRIIGRVRINTIISGGTGSGKTTLLNCLTGAIDETERVITCEDTAELQLQQPHVVRMETRVAGTEGTGEIRMQELVKNALRMKPHRIIVGEVRDAAAVDLIQAMNTGHNGSMGTVHANDPARCLSRLEALMRTSAGSNNMPSHLIRQDLSESVEVIIQTRQFSTDGRRVITHITEITGIEGDAITKQDVFKWDARAGVLRGTGVNKPRFWERAVEYGEGEALLEALANANSKLDPTFRKATHP
ncbi:MULTISPECIES: CpaF family protein [unclassified Xanthobacter]|uniref:CpaF family protein n=1 Tax=unclassified Xanthobacter TaxID=2623496 RepID=UPI001F1C626C|nr:MULTISPECIES: CpaF family protein [unclassified Xanthobacter]